MRRPFRTALGVLALGGALMLVTILSGPSAPPATSPYWNALSDFTLGSTALAQPACENKACGAAGPCVHSVGFRCDRQGPLCHTVAC
jgi:hypothetical protein